MRETKATACTAFGDVMNIALIGKTGSGKTTVAKSLSYNFGLQVLDSKIFHEYVKSQGTDWQIMQRALQTGEYAPDYLLSRALELKLLKSTGNKFVIDNLPCVAFLETFEKHKHLNFAFHLQVSDEESMHRISARARETNITQQFKNRKLAFEANFNQLKNSLGQKMITIDAHKAPEEVYKQIESIIIS